MRYFVLIVGVCLALVIGGGNLVAQAKPKDPTKEKEKDQPKAKEIDQQKKEQEITEFGGKKLAQWIADIKSYDPAVRENAIRTVPMFGKAARKAVKALINELRDPDPSLRVNAAISLGLIGMDEADVKEGVRALGRVLTTDPQINVRYQAAITLGKIGADAKEASPQLRSALLDRYSSWELRQAAALALAGTGWELKETDPNNPKTTIWVAEPKTVAALVSIAKQDVAAKVRQQALTSLIYLGMPYNPADLQNEKAGLLSVLKDHDPIVAMWARVVLMRIDKLSEVYLKDIANQLKHSDLPVRVAAAQALGMIGPSAKSRTPDLVHALNEKDPLLTMTILTAVVQIGDDSPTVMNGLDQLMNGTQNEALKQVVQKAKEQLKLRADEIRKGEMQAPKGPDNKTPKGTDPKPPKKKGP